MPIIKSPIRRATAKSCAKGGQFYTQGYSANQLAHDLAKVRANKDNPDFDITQLHVGNDARAYKPEFNAMLEEVTKKLKLSPKVSEYHEGPFKKVTRLYAKSVNYMVAKGGDTPIVERVRDILRGTIILPDMALLEHFCKPGNNVIDMLQAAAKKRGWRIVQVKNRYIQGRFPLIQALDGKLTPDELEKLYRPGWSKRDWFYRDMQLLVAIPKHGAGRLAHHVAEIQITTRRMYQTKSAKVDDGYGGLISGHKAYKSVRNVLERIEARANAEKKGAFSPEAQKLYAASVTDEDEADFGKNLKAMWSIYYNDKNRKTYPKGVRLAIANSKWFQTMNQQDVDAELGDAEASPKVNGSKKGGKAVPFTFKKAS